MKIGVVGTFIRDQIFPWRGERTDSIGGIFFTVSYLANLTGQDVEIFPVANVGADFYDTIRERLSSYRNVKTPGLRKLPNDNTQVNLVYTGPQDRYEVTSAPMPALRFEELKLLRDADVVMVNLITGTDVDREALYEFRKISDALIYLDFHSHALGITKKGRRYYRRPEDWQEWVKLADVLQLNEQEARTLARYSSDLPTDVLIGFGKKLVQMHPDVCHITLADNGTLLFYKEDDQIRSRKFDALPIADVVDVIGCGDAFAAGYVVNYLASRDVVTATDFAIEVAGMNCTFMGSSGISEIQRLLRKRMQMAS